MKTVTVLDFATGEVHIYQYKNNIGDIDEFLMKKGHDINNSLYMCTDRLILQIH